MPARPLTLKDFGSELGLDLASMLIPSSQVSGAIGTSNPGFYNVADYGATLYSTIAAAKVGTNSTAGIQATIDAAAAAGGGFVFFGGFARASTAIAGKNNIILIGEGYENSGIVFDDVAGNGINWNGGAVNTINTAITVDAAQDTRVLTVTSSASFAAGDDVYITDNWQIGGEITYQEKFHTRIRTVDSATQMTVEDPLPTTYKSAKSATVGKPTAGYWSDIGARDLTFICGTSPARSANITYLVQAQTAKGITFERCRFDGAVYGMYVQFCKNFRLANCFFDHIYDRVNTTGVTAQALLLETTTQALLAGNQSVRCGSGFVCQWGNVDVSIVGNVMQGSNVEARTQMTGPQTLPVGTLNVGDTSLFTTSGTLVVALGGLGGTPVLVTYTNKTGTTFTGCSGGSGLYGTGTIVGQGLTSTNTDNGGRGLKTLGCSRVTVACNYFGNFGDQGFLCEGMANVDCVGNIFEHAQDKAVGLEARLVAIQSDSGGDEGGRSTRITFADNTCRDSQGPGVFVSGGAGNISIHNNTIQNCALASGQTSPLYINSSTTGVRITNNRVEGFPAGDYGIAVFGGSCLIALNHIATLGGGSQAIVTSAGTGGNKIGVNFGGDPYLLHATDFLSDTQTKKAVYSGVGANQTPDAAAAEYFTINVTNATAFTINAPTNPTSGMTISLDIKNSSGGAMGAITWNAAFLGGGAGTVGTGAFTGIANGKRRLIIFRYDGTTWQEVSRTADQ